MSQPIRSTSPSSEPLPIDNIQVTINTTPGKSIKLNVLPIHTVANIVEFLSASATIPSDSKLVLAGKILDPSTTVASLDLTESSNLNLLTPRSAQELDTTTTTTTTKTGASTSASSSGTATPTKKKSNKPRCAKDGCKTFAQPIVGDCGFCQKCFCGKHRMLESHSCTGLDDAKQADKARNTAKLESERTVALRGL